MSRMPAVIAAVAVVLVGLTACSPAAPSLDAATAKTEYQPVLTEIVSALSDAYPDITWTSTGTSELKSRGDDSPCHLSFDTAEGSANLSSEEGSWATVWETINPILADHGFAEISGEDDLDGGYTGISSRDTTGAELTVKDKDTTEVSLSIPVTDTDC